MGIPGPVSRSESVKTVEGFLKCGKFLWFLAAGILSTVTDIGILYVLTENFGVWYLFSATVSYCCGILVSFFLNKYITFNDTRTDPFRQFPLFVAISAGSLILNLIVLFVTVNQFSFHYLAGKIVAVSFSFFWNYLGQSRVTFRE